jgi:hypothetical protein
MRASIKTRSARAQAICQVIEKASSRAFPTAFSTVEVGSHFLQTYGRLSEAQPVVTALDRSCLDCGARQKRGEFNFLSIELVKASIPLKR